MAGIIYFVSTPIGNLKDITIRALETLESVDIIAAEDTRQTLKLLNHYNIKKPLISYHEHNKRESGEKIIKEVLNGKDIALVTDAGTPGISDPGEALVNLAVENGIEIYLTPGPAAFVYGLVVSGLSTSRFVFEGFLPVEKKERKERLENIKDEEKTIIFYEAPHKLQRTLKDMCQYLGDRKIALCRELTKRYEEIIRTTLFEALAMYEDKKPLGEFVLVVEGKKKEEIDKERAAKYEGITIEEHIKMYIDLGMDKKEAIKKVAKERNLSKSDVYKHSIDI